MDGRLSDEQREAFETLLEQDAELARRVEAYRYFGRALREGDPQVPVGFYTRARARFEEARRGKDKKPYRLLSWEAAGLTAAAVLAGVLFVPGVLQWYRGGEPLPGMETKGEAREPVVATEDRLVEIEEEAIAGDERPKEEPVVSRAPTEPVQSRDDRLQETTPRGLAVPAAEEQDEEEAATAAADLHAVAENEGKRSTVAKAQFVTDRSTEEQPPAPTEKSAPPTARQRGAAAEAWHIKREKKMATDGEPSQAVSRIFRLPQGVVEPDSVVVIETEEEWEARFAGRVLGDSSPFDSYDPALRWVLIGAPPAPIDCAAISVIAGENSYRIILPPAAEPHLAAEWGCAVAVEKDRRAVEVSSPRIDSHD